MEDSFELSRFGRDLTAEARAGKLPPIIGREEIIARVMEVLGRSTKNNPILVGEPGVGKTAIVEGLAQVIASDKAPSWLRGKQLVALDMAALVAGTRARGDFEERLKLLAEHLRTQKGQIILFVDEIHQLVSLGREGSVDAANFLKPMLARGEIPCVGATTFDEYRQIEKDGALARRYVMVRVNEPEPQETLAILRGLRERYEGHHGVRINDEALQAAIDLTNRFIVDRRQPDKAIDVLDEACAYLKAIGELPPDRIRELETEVNQLKVEESALRREGGDPLVRVRSEIRIKEKELSGAVQVWKDSSQKRARYAALLARKDTCMARIDAAERELRLKDVVDLKLNELKEIQAELSLLELNVKQRALDASTVAEAVARMTRIRAAGTAADAASRLAKLEQMLMARWPHQHLAIRQVRDGLARSFAGIVPEHRPLLNAFIKANRDDLSVEFTRSIAAELCEGAFVVADMREYSEKSSITKLIGAPPAYAGFESSTHLLEKVRQRGHCVVLFRNMDQAHEEVARLIMSITADGVLTDGMGRSVTFKHALVFLSGGEVDHWGTDFQVEMKALEADDRRGAIRFWIRDLQGRIAPRATIDCSEDAIEFLAGCKSEEIADVRRRFREMVETPLANLLIEKADDKLLVHVLRSEDGVAVRRA